MVTQTWQALCPLSPTDLQHLYLCSVYFMWSWGYTCHSTCVMRVVGAIHMERSENNLENPFSSYCVDAGDQTQVVRLFNGCLCSPNLFTQPCPISPTLALRIFKKILGNAISLRSTLVHVCNTVQDVLKKNMITAPFLHSSK